MSTQLETFGWHRFRSTVSEHSGGTDSGSASERLGAFISYADDFVILCRDAVRAEEALATISAWLTKLSLKLHPEKTRLCDAWKGSFDFLGYTFGKVPHWRTGKSIIVAEPSKKAQKRLKEKINLLLYRGNPRPWPELRDTLNRQLRGWANYFSFGYFQGARQAINNHLLERVHRFLSKRHKLRPHGNRAFLRQGHLWPLGCDRHPAPQTATHRACLLVNPVREPDAVVLHVRFDERRRETEPWSGD